jgi:hypothetical protein
LRRWPSTNGPFFNERAIACSFLHAAQPAPLRPAHLLESAHRTGHAVGLRAERANEARSLRIGNAFHHNRPAGLAQLVEHRFWRRDWHFHRGTHRLAVLLDCRSLWGRALDGPGVPLCSSAPQRPPTGAASCSCRSRSCRSHCCTLTGQPCQRRPILSCFCFAEYSQQLLTTSPSYLRRCTICLSVRLLRRVFLPSVGKAQGVWG